MELRDGVPNLKIQNIFEFICLLASLAQSEMGHAVDGKGMGLGLT